MAAVSQLAALPEELVSNISHRLGSDDAFAFRLTCKALETKSFHDFATEYFNEKAVHLTTESLRTVVAIASNERLREYLKELYIIPALFDESMKCPNSSYGMRQIEAYRTYVIDQKQLRESGNDKTMLIESLDKLKSLKLVSFADDPSCLKRTTDYRGFFSVLRKTNTRPITGTSLASRKSEFKSWFSYVWVTLLGALASTEIQGSIREFITSSNGAYHVLSLRNLSLLKEYKTRKGLGKTLGNVSRLKLQMRSRDTTSNQAKDARTLLRFAGVFKNVSDLSLNFQFSETSGAMCNIFLSQIKVGALTKLMLESLEINEGSLTSIVRSHPLLAGLRLESVNLTSGTWLPILKAIGKLEKLIHLHLMYLREGRCKAYFLTQRDPVELEAQMAQQGAEDAGWQDDEGSESQSDAQMPDLISEDGETAAPAAFARPEATAPNGGGKNIPELEGDAEMPALVGDSALASANPFTAPSTDLSINTSNGFLHSLPLPGTMGASSTLPLASPLASEAVEPQRAETQVTSPVMPEHVPPGDEGCGERGFYICIKGKEIAQQLPVFLEEYNVSSIEDDGDMLAGLGPMMVPAGVAPPGLPPQVFNSIMNGFAATFGAMPMPMPPPAGVAANPPMPQGPAPGNLGAAATGGADA